MPDFFRFLIILIIPFTIAISNVTATSIVIIIVLFFRVFAIRSHKSQIIIYWFGKIIGYSSNTILSVRWRQCTLSVLKARLKCTPSNGFWSRQCISWCWSSFWAFR